MDNPKKFIVSHAPFWHNGSSIAERSCQMMLATVPVLLLGVYQYGIMAVRVIALSVSMAMIWELAANRMMKRAYSIGDGNAAVIGLLFAMLLPATTPWWTVVIGTFVAIFVGKQIYGGIGGNPFNPVLVGMAIVFLSWKGIFDFNEALVNYDFGFNMVYPLAAIKQHGAAAAGSYSLTGLLMGQQTGGIGATFGLGLILGGLYLILKGVIRWEISLSYLAGVFITALVFNLVNPIRFAPAEFHLLTGFTLIAAFFLVTEDSSSPVNLLPMILYGAGAGIMTVLIRNIGAYVDGAVFAILRFNIANPLLDKIMPKALGKVDHHA
ncbi:MAG: RnfABCDGE type electron transport complex subunit D [Desulfatirhabdiaceae bacterium]|nr:RnfABCDGE type electron transport complex subunit D [Desulfatirhabdiaceae bacterium]